MPSKTTTDHETIKKWVEGRGGRPAHVKSTGKRGDLGVLRVDYPGFAGEDTLEEVEWDDWFAAFDKSGLAFLYDTKKNSRFSKLVSRRGGATAKTRAGTKKRAASKPKARAGTKTRTATKKRTAKKTAAPKRTGAKTTARRGTPAKRTSTAKRTRATGTKARSKRSAAT